MGNLTYLYIRTHRAGSKAEMPYQGHPTTKVLLGDVVLQQGQCLCVAPCKTRASHTQFNKYFFYLHFPLAHLCRYGIYLPCESQQKQEKGILNGINNKLEQTITKINPF